MVSFWEVFPRVPVVQPKTELRAHRSDGLTSGRPCGVPCGVPGYQCFPRRELPMAKTYHLKMYFLLDFRLEKVDFHCQVSLLEGKYGTTVDGSEIENKTPNMYESL